MITIQYNKPVAERLQSDHTSRELTFAAVQYPRLAASFDGGLVS